jgi:hypothetical protein
MKINKLLLVLFTSVISLTSCAIVPHSSSSKESSSSSSSSSEHISSSNQSSNSCLSSSYYATSSGKESVSSSSAYSSSSSEDYSNYKTLTLKSLVSGSYSENYDSYSVDGYNFAYYRASKFVNGVATLKPITKVFDISEINGSLLNENAIYGMKQIQITYQTKTTSSKAKISFGDNMSYGSSILLDASSSYVTNTYTVNGNFFKIETGDAELDIKSLIVTYDGVSRSYSKYDYDYSNDYFRLNPTTYSGTLVSGTSSIDVPTKVEKTSTGYNILETKKYTYYEYDEVISNKTLAYSVSLTDPMDIANYVIAFNSFPVNYVVQSNYSTATSYFKEKTRCISHYTRTNGYATAVPYAIYSNNKPLYYELDLALKDNYSGSSRGTGRLVIFMKGYSTSKTKGYDSSNVALFTDDHYQTFSEYLNTGSFGPRFNAENSTIVSTTWKEVPTLN